MTTITDECMSEMLPKSREYCIVQLKPGSKADQPGVEKILGSMGSQFRLND